MPATVEDKAALYKELEPLLHDPRHYADGRIMSFCPAHPDGQKSGNRSLSLHPTIGLTCFAGCDFKAILEGLRGSAHSNGWHQPENERDGKTVAVYEYRDTGGALVAEKCRIEFLDGRKIFNWRLPGGIWKDGLGKPPVLRMRDIPLYGAEDIAKADPKAQVWYVEGEKAQRAMTLQGFLSVTHGGGASTRDFGASLDVLKGHPVVLWPDNDVVGREYMNAVQARLKAIGVQSRYAVCPIALPPKGDAYDYFNLGGKADALRDIIAKVDAPPQEPTVMVTDDDGLLVTMPRGNQAIRFELTDIEIGRRAFDAELKIILPGSEPYEERVNLLSSNQRTELRRELDNMFGKEYDWARLLNKAFGMARAFHGSLDRAFDVVDAQNIAEQEFDIADLLPAGQPTILFGDGGAAKSTMACLLAFHYCTGLPFLGRTTPAKPVIYVDWEDTFDAFSQCIRRIGGSPEILLSRGLLFYWPANGIPLQQQAEALREKAQKEGAGLVIYDTVAPGCGGPPEDSVSATSFMNAVRRVKTTAFCLAHITKAGQEDKPFGSAFWHNSARRTWLIKRDSDEDTDQLDLALICKKVNHGRKPKSIPVHLSFIDPDGLITAKVGTFDPASDLTKAATTLNSRIKQALLRGAMSRSELADTLGETDDTIRTTMNRHREMYTPVGSKWGLST